MDCRACCSLGLGGVALVVGLCAAAATVDALEQRDEIYRRRAPYLWAFYTRHPKNYGLTTAAHWAHGSISDLLLDTPPDPEAAAEADARFMTQAVAVLGRPARVEPEQADVGPAFARLAPLAPKVIDWTHALHEALYDIMADPSLTEAQQRRYLELETEYYLSEPGLAFSPAPLEVIVRERLHLMRQPWFKAFRRDWPQSAHLFWAFHWWHPAVYEAQVVYHANQTTAVEQIDRVFWKEVLPAPPNRMLLSREVMPRFAEMAPEAANIFDNLHQFHGIAYDILASPLVADKRAEIYRMLELMLVRPGDRELARTLPRSSPVPELDPLRYEPWMRTGPGAMGAVMGMTGGHDMGKEHRAR